MSKGALRSVFAGVWLNGFAWGVAVGLAIGLLRWKAAAS